MTLKSNHTNNPLTIAVEGAKLLFQKAPMAALILAVLSALNAVSYFSEESSVTPESGPHTVASETLEPAVLAMIIILGIILLFGALIVGSILTGIFAYTSAEIAHGREVTFRQAIKATFSRLWSFVWLQILTISKVLLWSLLLVVPGIIMAFRYSLANLSFFDQNKKLTGNAAIQDSVRLTKDAWLTTFSSQVFLNIITFGLISPIIDTGSKAMLYRQFTELERTNTPKPKPHTLSWVTLGVILLIVIVVISLLGFAIVNYGLSLIES